MKNDTPEIKPYLIQRATFNTTKDKQGIDSILNFDYMGSAEFEFGALPKSLTVIRKDKKNYNIFDVKVKDKVISVFCPNKYSVQQITNYLNTLDSNDIHLKERSDFNTYTSPSKWDNETHQRYPHSTDFWWDITNHIMFWKKNNKFEKAFNSKI